MATPATESELDDCLSEPDDQVIQVLSKLPGRFIVLGAGGKMGFHVCRMLQRGLQAAGHSEAVTAVSRFGDSTVRQQFEQCGLGTRSADLSVAADVDQLPEADYVFYLAGVKFGTHDRPELLQRFNVDMPQLVSQRYRGARIVALSTGCVYSYTTPESGGSTEESPTDPPGAYAQSCLGREQAFIDAATRWGTRSSLIRLNYSIDLRYGVLVDIARKVLSDEPIELSMGFANVIWQRDAISHVIQTLPHASAPPFVINVTGPDTLSVRALAESLARRLNRTASFTGSEQSTAWLSNAAKAHRQFGLPAVSVDQMIDWTAGWLEQGGQTLGKPTHFETRSGDY